MDNAQGTNYDEAGISTDAVTMHSMLLSVIAHQGFALGYVRNSLKGKVRITRVAKATIFGTVYVQESA
jgi:hypothetical protein